MLFNRELQSQTVTPRPCAAVGLPTDTDLTQMERNSAVNITYRHRCVVGMPSFRCSPSKKEQSSHRRACQDYTVHDLNNTPLRPLQMWKLFFLPASTMWFNNQKMSLFFYTCHLFIFFTYIFYFKASASPKLQHLVEVDRYTNNTKQPKNNVLTLWR